MRLKPAGIFIIVAIIAVLAYFAFKSKFSSTNKETTEQATTPPSRTDTANNNPPAATKQINGDAREFNYCLLYTSPSPRDS